MPHAILYPLFDFHFHHQLPNFFDTETQLRNLIMSKALAIMEEVMDEYEVKGKVWYIDKLELDLGEIEVDNLYRDFPQKLRQTFRKKLAKIRFDAQLVPEIYKSETQSTQESQQQVAWEALQMYIEEGEKRWWMLPNDQNTHLGIKNSQKTTFLRLFGYLAEENQEELKTFLQQIKENEQAKNRILGQINIEIFAKIALGEKNALLYQYFLQVSQELIQIAGFFSAKNSFEKHILLEFWKFGLEKNLTFTKEKLNLFLYQAWERFSNKIPYFPSMFALSYRLQELPNTPKISKNTQKLISESIEKGNKTQNLSIYQEVAFFTQNFAKNQQEDWRKYLIFWENNLIKKFNFSKENAQKTLYKMVFLEKHIITPVPKLDAHIVYLEEAILIKKIGDNYDDFLTKREKLNTILEDFKREFINIKVPTQKQAQNRGLLEKNYEIFNKTNEISKDFKEKELMELVSEVYPTFAPDLILFLRELFAKNAWFNAPLQALKRYVWQTISNYFLKNRYGVPDMLDLAKEILINIQKKFYTESYNFDSFWQRSNIITQYNTKKLKWEDVIAQDDVLDAVLVRNTPKNISKFSEITQVNQIKQKFSTKQQKDNLLELVLSTQKNDFLAWIDDLSKITATHFKGISTNTKVWKEILVDNLLAYLFLNKDKSYKIADFAQYLAEIWIKNYHITAEYLQEIFIDVAEWQLAIRQNRQNTIYAVQSLRYFLETGAILWTATWKNQGFTQLEKDWFWLMETQSQIFKAILNDFRLSYMSDVPKIIHQNIKHYTLKKRLLEALGYELNENVVLSKKQLRKKLLKDKRQAEQTDFEDFFINKTDNSQQIEDVVETNEQIFPLQKKALQNILKQYQQDIEQYVVKINQAFDYRQIFDVEKIEKIRDDWQQKYNWVVKMLDLLEKQGNENHKNVLENHWYQIKDLFPNVFAQNINPLWFSLEVGIDFLKILTKKFKNIIQKQLIWIKNIWDMQAQDTRFLLENALPKNIQNKIKRNIQYIYQNYQKQNIDANFFENKKQEIFEKFERLSIKREFISANTGVFLEELNKIIRIESFLTQYLFDKNTKLPKKQDFFGFETLFTQLKATTREKKTLFLLDFSKNLQVFYAHFLAVMEGIYVEIERINVFLAKNPSFASNTNIENQKKRFFPFIFTYWKSHFAPKNSLKQLLNKYINPQNADIIGIDLQEAKKQAHIWVENLLHFDKYKDFSIKILQENGQLLNFRIFLQEFYKNFPEILILQWQNISHQLKNEVKETLPTLYKIIVEESHNFKQEFQNIDQQIKENTYQGRGNKVENPKENAKKILEKIAEITQKTEKKQNQRKDEPLYVQNAGLVILHPYLGRLFGMLGWLKEGAFVDLEAQTKAVLALEFMASKKYEGVEEGDLLLNKILVGMTFKDALLPDVVLAEKELDICESLLKGVLQNWKSMSDSSIDNFRVSFLRREGRLVDNFGTWTLRVEQKTWDILMERLPWSIVLIKLPFMRMVLNVEWGG